MGGAGDREDPRQGPAATARAANATSAATLATVAGQVSKDPPTSEVRPGWTAAAIFLHLALWDRFVAARWRRAALLGHATPESIGDGVVDLVNEAVVPTWANVELTQAAHAALEAARLADATIAGLSDEAVIAVRAEGRPHLVDRSVHRLEHLSELQELIGRR